ncbi:hypothetical protein MTR_3g006700 [Medicago truncatula]|uniref:Transmembrane protein n=1 Tax=Medicago truncatula TaxID=3880 RepID=A0A072UT71_MEDTR|nr:hypothetical protein MTR_3g006700 [Medicago truncatula]
MVLEKSLKRVKKELKERKREMSQGSEKGSMECCIVFELESLYIELYFNYTFKLKIRISFNDWDLTFFLNS